LTQNLPKATHGGTLKIGDATISCAVLEDGSRVLTQDTFIQSIGRLARGPGGEGAMASSLPVFLRAKNLDPYITPETEELAQPIVFKPLRGHKAYGYRAELLPVVCNIYLKARDDGVLIKGARGQERIAATCDVLIRGLATVGIIALVDEVTGYQYDRNRDALNKILEAYIARELLPWAKRIPDEFYRQLFRLRGWQYNPVSVKRPVFVGKLTNQLVYEQLPDGVLEELKHKNPKDGKGRRKHRHHQFLTEDIGNPHLDRHIASVTTLMRASADWRGFLRLFHRAFQKPYQEEIFETDQENEQKQ
jgi:hypothetical protein